MSLLAFFAIGGAICGLVYSWGRGLKIDPPHFRAVWLVYLFGGVQLATLYLPGSLTDAVLPISLIGSQAVLLGFIWLNRQELGLKLIGVGLALNSLVIIFNGGFMPISPETLSHLVPDRTFEPGHRFGTSKDIILTVEQTRLWFLSDRLLLPVYQLAFSPGDIFVALGGSISCFQLFRPNGQHPNKKKNTPLDIIGRAVRWPVWLVQP